MAENYQVYLSSTYQDLQDCRKAVYAALQKVARAAAASMRRTRE